MCAKLNAERLPNRSACSAKRQERQHLNTFLGGLEPPSLSEEQRTVLLEALAAIQSPEYLRAGLERSVHSGMSACAYLVAVVIDATSAVDSAELQLEILSQLLEQLCVDPMRDNERSEAVPETNFVSPLKREVSARCSLLTGYVELSKALRDGRDSALADESGAFCAWLATNYPYLYDGVCSEARLGRLSMLESNVEIDGELLPCPPVRQFLSYFDIGAYASSEAQECIALADSDELSIGCVGQ